MYASVPQSLMEGRPPVKIPQSLSMFKYVSTHTHIEPCKVQKNYSNPLFSIAFLLIGFVKDGK